MTRAREEMQRAAECARTSGKAKEAEQWASEIERLFGSGSSSNSSTLPKVTVAANDEGEAARGATAAGSPEIAMPATAAEAAAAPPAAAADAEPAAKKPAAAKARAGKA